MRNKIITPIFSSSELRLMLEMLTWNKIEYTPILSEPDAIRLAAGKRVAPVWLRDDVVVAVGFHEMYQYMSDHGLFQS